jgi:hypothetical protein
MVSIPRVHSGDEVSTAYVIRLLLWSPASEERAASPRRTWKIRQATCQAYCRRATPVTHHRRHARLSVQEWIAARYAQAARGLIADTATERVQKSLQMRLVAFLATASRGAASGNNDRLSTLWREVISLAGVARSFSKASSYRNFQCRDRDAMPD